MYTPFFRSDLGTAHNAMHAERRHDRAAREEIIARRASAIIRSNLRHADARGTHWIRVRGVTACYSTVAEGRHPGEEPCTGCS